MAEAVLDPSSVQRETAWPAKVDLFGVQVSVTSYAEIVACVTAAYRAERSAIVSCHAVHAIVTSHSDPVLLAKVNRFDAVTPDGQPVRWALNRFHASGLQDRVYGPTLMLKLCRAAANDGVSIFLYGSMPNVLKLLEANLRRKFPGLKIAGSYSPPFRELSSSEDEEIVRIINESGAGIAFIGLGCPRQDEFAFAHRDSICAVQVCVGAAFDFHAGTTPVAPQWMQKFGLEWVYRLCREPKRLWKRYLVTNTLFVWLAVREQIARNFGENSSRN